MSYLSKGRKATMASAIDELGDYMVEIVDKCEERGMASAIDELGDYMVEIVDKCEERGVQVPFIVCAVRRRGPHRRAEEDRQAVSLHPLV
jgi:hypothetical protein